MEKQGLEGLSHFIEESGKKREAENVEFNEALGEPDAVYETEDYSYGYFKCPEGVVKMEKFSNGYAIRSQIFLSREEIEAINKAWNVT